MSLADVNGTVVLAATDCENLYQHWRKVQTDVQDTEGRPSFALVNEATGKKLKHSFGHGYPVRLLRTNQQLNEDPSLIWVANARSSTDDDDDGFHGVCMVNNLEMGFDIHYNSPLHVHYLYTKKFEGNDNQVWKMEPWELTPKPDPNPRGRRYGLDGPTKRIVCRANSNLTLAVRDGRVVLATPNRMDEYQHWIFDGRYCTMVKDTDGCWPLSLVNKGSGRALKHSFGNGHAVRLVPYNPDFMDESIMWSGTKRDWGDGFNCIRMINNINSVLSTPSDDPRQINDGVQLILSEWKEAENQLWRFYDEIGVDLDGFVYRFTKSIDINDKDPVVHKHTPYIVILVRLAEKWADEHDGRLPSTRQEKKNLSLYFCQDLIRNHMLNLDEENYKEAVESSYKVSVTLGISNEIRQIIDDSFAEVNSCSSDFWVLVATLKGFRRLHISLSSHTPSRHYTTEPAAAAEVAEAEAQRPEGELRHQPWCTSASTATVGSLRLLSLVHLSFDSVVFIVIRGYRDGKTFKKPRRPYEKERLDAELKKSRWHLLTLDEKNPRRIFEGEALLRRMNLYGLLAEGQNKLDYVLALTAENFLARRLQTLVFKAGMAKSIHHARVLIRQRHIRVSRQIVNVPSFMVRLESEKHIDFSLTSPFGGGLPGRVKRKNTKKASGGGDGGGDSEDEE
ncbi:hypothetical protein ABZP36_034493 [Zizania latifolia]